MTITPGGSAARLPSPLACRDVVRTAVVEHRGVTYPQLPLLESSSNSMPVGDGWIATFTESLPEVWRMSGDGVFNFCRSLSEDHRTGAWMRAIGPRVGDRFLDLESAVYLLTESLEFAANIAASLAIGNSIQIDQKISDSFGRKLVSGWGWKPPENSRCESRDISLRLNVQPDSLIRNHQHLAVRLAQDFVEHFGATAPRSKISALQDRLLQPRFPRR